MSEESAMGEIDTRLMNAQSGVRQSQVTSVTDVLGDLHC